MRNAPRRQTFVIGSILAVVIGGMLFTVPAAAVARAAIYPRLPSVVIVLGTLVGAWHLVAGIVASAAHGGIRPPDAVALSLGVGALFMAVAFLPSPHHTVPHLSALVGAAIFTVAAAALQRRSHVSSRR